jgi:hypothetical protein
MIPVPLPLLETLPEIFNQNAVKSHQRFSLNLCNISKVPSLWLKKKMVVMFCLTLLLETFLFPGLNWGLKGQIATDTEILYHIPNKDI